MFKEDLTKEELEEHFERFVKGKYHDEDGNIIISRKTYNKNIKATKEHFDERIHHENVAAYESGKSPVNEPKVFKGCSLEDFNVDGFPSGFVEKIKEMARNKDSFYLQGTFGAGKSRFCWAFAKYLYLTLGMRDIIVIRYIDIFKKAKMVYGNYEYSDTFNKMCECKTLIIDDIKTLKGKKDAEYDLFLDLLDTRLERDLTTIFTSNLGHKSLAGDDGSARLTSRIERILKKKENLVRFREQFYKF